MDPSFLERLTGLIEDHISQPHFGVQELSHEMGMSHSNLLRKVRSLTGKSVSRLIRDIRLGRAMDLLQGGELTVAEVAYRTGFSSPSYFASCFREHFGYSPGAVKNLPTVNQDQAGMEPGVDKAQAEVEPEHNTIPGKPVKFKNLRIAFLLVLGLAIILTGFFLTPKLLRSSNPLDKSIAVVPFTVMADNPVQQRDADGIYDLLVQYLSRISELRVIPAQSMERYRNGSKTINEIGQESDVKHVGKGSFRTFGDSLTLTFRLFESSSERLIWDTIFQGDCQKIFYIQSEVAEGIAGQISAAMTPVEKRAIQVLPTKNSMAWQCFLSAKEYRKQDFWSHFNVSAIQWYQKAVDYDPGFVGAWLGLASSYREIFFKSWDRREETRLLAKKYLDRARSIAPDLKEVRLEEACYYYQCCREFSKSLALFESLKSEYPNDGEICFWIGCIYRRLGLYGKALKHMDQAISMNPMEMNYWSTQAMTERANRDYVAAGNSMNRAIDLNPAVWGNYEWMILMYLRNGQIDRAGDYLNAHQNLLSRAVSRICHSWLECLNRNYDQAAQWMDSLPKDPFNGQTVYFTKNRELAMIYRLIPDTARAAFHFRAERDFLLRKIQETGGDERMYCSLGICYAGIGRKTDALDAGERALSLMNIDRDSYAGFVTEIQVVQILVMVGEYDPAMEKLALIMSKNGDYCAESLQLDPFWDPVRKHPKFIKIINNPAYRAKPASQIH